MVKKADVKNIISAAQPKPVIHKRRMTFEEMLDAILKGEVEGNGIFLVVFGG